MGIFTKLNETQIQTLLDAYALNLQTAQGVTEGTVNTYYRVTTDRGLYYLRIDERGDRGEVDKELHCLDALSTLAVPHIVKTQAGESVIACGEKSALLFAPLAGAPIPASHLSSNQMHEIGTWLASLHQVPLPNGFHLHRFHPEEIHRRYLSIRTHLDNDHAQARHALETLLSGRWKDYCLNELPQAIIHADLFEENLLFQSGKLTAVLDFEAAGRGPRLLDLAIALQALCFNGSSNTFDLVRAGHLVDGYRAHITPTAGEQAAWPQLLDYSALRFLVTRLKDFEFSGLTASEGHWKDYREYLAHLADLDRLHPLLY